MTASDIADFVDRLDLAQHRQMIGAHFPEIIALLSIVFGGAFLLFGWRHHEYFLGVTGLIVGGWCGLLLKTQMGADGALAPFFYLLVFGASGAYLGACCPRFVGILLGGFTVALFLSLFSRTLFQPGEKTLLGLCAIFLLGGGLGGLFPKFFFILNSSLIGSSFLTYGLSLALLAHLPQLTPQVRVLLHLLIFLPLFAFGLFYQGLAPESGSGSALVPLPRARSSRPVRTVVEVTD